MAKKATASAESDLYALLVEMSGEAVVLHCNGQIVIANEAAALLLGAKSAQQLIGQPSREFLPPSTASAVSKQVTAYPRRRSVATQVTRLDGTAVDVMLLERACAWQGQRAQSMGLVVHAHVSA